MVAVSVVMPCHNRAFDLLRVLRAYERQEGDVPFEIIAVDDGSTDGTFEVLSSYSPSRFSLRVERLDESQGPARARNRGIALAQAPIILFVGDDILPSPRLVQGHWESHQVYRSRQVAILGRIAWPPDMAVSTLMKHIDGVGAQQFSYHFLKDGCEYDFRHFYTANVSIKRDFLRSLERWFDPSFPYAAFEDAELAFRMAQRGLRIIYRRPLLAYHYHYHTVWSFSRRQYKSGYSAWLFVKKHPYVARWLIRRGHVVALAAASCPWRLERADSHGYLRRLEEVLLHLASSYEWDPSPAADAFYLPFLDYFYFKGLVDAMAGGSPFAERALRAYVVLELKRRLKFALALERRPEKAELLKDLCNLA
ncbi:MAG: hypothetical protein DRI61_12185 [Chloroflexi bacterium]|nr:MAG: hypothetical protein DRI61_12185 [Chloroflexota bacterium]